MTAPSYGAAGKVITGFSYPFVAKYAESSGSIVYSDIMELARGVSVDIQPDTPDDNDFYANNQKAESGPKKFRSGTLNLTVDGLLIAAEKFIAGLPNAGEDGWISAGDSATPPYVGVGFITRYMSGGVEGFEPTVIAKVRFNILTHTAETEGEDGINWQTKDLTASIYRADDANHSWKFIGAAFTTEADALAALKAKLGYVAPVSGSATS
jgi:hypothetical protein